MCNLSRLAAIVLFVCIALPLQAQQYDFFWSFEDLNQGATNGPASKTLDVGDTGALFLYYSTNGPANQDVLTGAVLDIWTSRVGAIKFTGAEVYNFPILFSQYECDRWLDDGSGICILSGGNLGAFGFGKIENDLINEWGAFAITSFGIWESNAGGGWSDLGYDRGADAFLFGRIDFEILTNTRGSIEINLAPGNGGVLTQRNMCSPKQVALEYGPATIDVVGSYLLGDVNQDSEISLLDVAPFVDLLASGSFQLEADTNFDGQLNTEDVAGFVDLIVGNPPVYNPPLGDPQMGLIGDVNCDGYVNMLDGHCLVELIIDELDPCDLSTADLNGDEEISLLDLQMIVDVILKNIH